MNLYKASICDSNLQERHSIKIIGNSSTEVTLFLSLKAEPDNNTNNILCSGENFTVELIKKDIKFPYIIK